MARVLGSITDNAICFAPSDSSVTISVVKELVAADGGDAYVELIDGIIHIGYSLPRMAGQTAAIALQST
jgi:hypothetical protein